MVTAHQKMLTTRWVFLSPAFLATMEPAMPLKPERIDIIDPLLPFPLDAPLAPPPFDAPLPPYLLYFSVPPWWWVVLAIASPLVAPDGAGLQRRPSTRRAIQAVAAVVALA